MATPVRQAFDKSYASIVLSGALTVHHMRSLAFLAFFLRGDPWRP